VETDNYDPPTEADKLLFAYGVVVLNALASLGPIVVTLHEKAFVEVFLWHGVRSCAPVLLALWLTWGVGSFLWRILAVLGLPVVVSSAWLLLKADAGVPGPVGYELLLITAIQVAMILGMHVLIVPLKALLGWRTTLEPEVSFTGQGGQMNPLYFLGWVAFVAIVLGFPQMARGLLHLPDEALVSLVINFGISYAVAAAVAFGLWDIRLTVQTRVAVTIFALLAVPAWLAVQSGHLRTEQFIGDLGFASGRSVAIFLSVVLWTWSGVRLVRPLKAAGT
jgi:hypothetical protein